MLFQLHIPKTGGTTLFRVLERCIPPEQIVLITAGGLSQLEPLHAEIEHAELVAGWTSHLGRNPAFPRPPKVLTILRDPAERSLSFYRYLQKNAAAGVFSAETQRIANEARARSLGDALLDPTSLLRRVVANVQVDFLSSQSIDYRIPTDDLHVRELDHQFDVAMRNLESCAWVDRRDPRPRLADIGISLRLETLWHT